MLFIEFIIFIRPVCVLSSGSIVCFYFISGAAMSMWVWVCAAIGIVAKNSYWKSERRSLRSLWYTCTSEFAFLSHFSLLLLGSTRILCLDLLLPSDIRTKESTLYVYGNLISFLFLSCRFVSEDPKQKITSNRQIVLQSTFRHTASKFTKKEDSTKSKIEKYIYETFVKTKLY